MEWVETTGTTLEEARERALDQLGVDQQEAEFETLAEPRTGLFGRLKEEARVRARVRPKAPPAKEERRDRRRKGRGGGSGGDGGSSASSGGGRGRGGSKSGGAKGGGRRRGGTDDGGSNTSGSQDRGKGKTTMSDDDQVEDMPIDEQRTLLVDFFENLADEFDLADAEVTVEEKDDDVLMVSVDGPGVGILIGPDANTMAALEEIARTIVQRHADNRRYARIRVDVGSYRERRTAALEAFARELADKVLETGTEHVAEPMSAPDRKVIHDVIVDIDGVETRSVGEDPRRRVVVAPSDD